MIRRTALSLIIGAAMASTALPANAAAPPVYTRCEWTTAATLATGVVYGQLYAAAIIDGAGSIRIECQFEQYTNGSWSGIGGRLATMGPYAAVLTDTVGFADKPTRVCGNVRWTWTFGGTGGPNTMGCNYIN